MDPDKRRLLDLSLLVHGALRKLKMDQRGIIPMTSFTFDEVRNYVWAYSLHKGKWFHLKADKTARVIHATRGPPPPWPRAIDDDPDEP
jgi:hypothetical protein